MSKRIFINICVVFLGGVALFYGLAVHDRYSDRVPLPTAIRQVNDTLPRAAIYQRCLQLPSQRQDLKLVFPLSYTKQGKLLKISLNLNLCEQQQIFEEPDLFSGFFQQAGGLISRKDIDEVTVSLYTKDGFPLEYHEPQ